MGFNTTVIIMNDAFGDIKKHPQEFVDNLITAASNAYMQPTDVMVGSYVNAASVIACDHADIQNIIATGGNYGTVLKKVYRGNRGHHNTEDKVELLRKLAGELGYRIAKKPVKTRPIQTVDTAS